MFSVSVDFVIQMVIKSIVALFLLCFIYYLFIKYYKKNKVFNKVFLRLILISLVLILIINIAFVLNANVTFNKIISSINNGEASLKVLDSKHNNETGKYLTEEIKIGKDSKLSLTSHLSNQKYKLEPYGYTIATLNYLGIEVFVGGHTKGYIQIIGDDFVDFKYGIFNYGCICADKNLLETIRLKLADK